MRIALTHAYSWPEVRRGAERIIEEQSRALAERGHDVTVFTAGTRAGRRQEDGVTFVRFRRLFTSENRHEAEFAWRLAPRLVTARFDAVHGLGPRDCLTAVRTERIRGHRSVYTNLGIPHRASWENRPDGAAHDAVVRGVDVYGCMSRHALAVLDDEYGRQGALTPGGVNFDRFQPAEKRETAPTVLFSGALDEPRKGARQLIEAVGLLGETEPELKLWLSGPGDADALLRSVTPAARDRVEVLPLGDPQAQQERYGRAWVTALPSKWDSFGMVIVESLACGTPVVTSTHAALPELVSVGETGALCDPDDPASIAVALGDALALSQRAGIADACRQSVRPYDWRTGVAPLLEDLYEG